MGWEILFKSWRKTLFNGFLEEWMAEIDLIIASFIQPALDNLRNHFKETAPTQNQNLVASLLNIWRSLLNELDDPELISNLEYKAIIQRIDYSFVFAFTWSIGASVTTMFRKKMDVFFKGLVYKDKKLKKIMSPTMTEGSIYDYHFDVKGT